MQGNPILSKIKQELTEIGISRLNRSEAISSIHYLILVRCPFINYILH